MTIPRPYIPIAIRVQVAERQLEDAGIKRPFPWQLFADGKRLKIALATLFSSQPVHLDHDPAIARRKYDPATGEYDPPANDPRFLIYRLATGDHDTKTNGAGRSTTLGSDIHEIAKTKRLERQAAGLPKRKRRSRPIRSNPKIPSRPFQSRHGR